MREGKTTFDLDTVEARIYTLCMRILADVVGFEWDDGNRDKNLRKHGVTNGECEESFGDRARVVHEDIVHSKGEVRMYLI